MTPAPSSYAPLIGVAVALLVMFLRFRKLAAGRRLRLEWLWVLPTILLLVSAVALFTARPTGLDWLWLVLALGLGGALGWVRGRMMQISVDPETHALNMKASPAALLFIVGLVLVRMALKTVAEQEAASWHLNAVLLTDAFLVFAFGLLGLQRLEMWLRGQRLLAEARVAKSAASAA